MAVGVGWVPPAYQIAQATAIVARFEPDGTIDPTFGAAGSEALSSPIPSGGTNVFVQSDGRVVLTGYSGVDTGQALLVRFFGTEPPVTTIDSGPSGTVHSSDQSVSFSAIDPSATFECSLDSSPFAPCSSPQALTGLPDGAHTFAVRATDSTGNLGDPASDVFTVDTAPPPPSYQPDAMISAAGGGFLGEGVYGLYGVGEIRTIHLVKGDRLSLRVRVRNDGTAPDSFLIKGAHDSWRISLGYVEGTADVTTPVEAGVYQVGPLAPGASADITMKFKMTRSVSGGFIRTLPITTESVAQPTARDRVLVVVASP